MTKEEFLKQCEEVFDKHFSSSGKEEICDYIVGVRGHEKQYTSWKSNYFNFSRTFSIEEIARILSM